MENLSLFFQYIVIGFMVPIFILPLTLLCLVKSLKDDSYAGISIGSGISAAFTLCSAIMVYSLSQTLITILQCIFYIKFVSCTAIIIIAIKALLPRRDIESKKTLSRRASRITDFITAFLLTLTTPVTFMIFMLLFMTKLFTRDESQEFSFIMTGGLFLGTLGAYMLLSYLATLIRVKLNPKISKFLACFSAVLIIIISVASLVFNYTISF